MKNSRPLSVLIGAEFLSHLGNQLAAIAIPLSILQFTGSPLLTGVAGAANVLPIFLAAFLGGRAVDRFGAWRMSIAADVLSFVSVLLLPLVFLRFTDAPPELIFGLVLLGALFDPTGATAKQTMVPRLARFGKISLETANSRRGALENSADFFGPILGAAIIGAAGVVTAFFLNAATFAASAIAAALFIPAPRRKKRKMVSARTVSGGLRFILTHPQLRGLAVAGAVANAAILPFLALALPMKAVELDRPELLGFTVAMFGAAAACGALFYSRLAARMSRSAIFYGGLILTGLSFFSCGLVSSAAALIFFSATAGILLGAGNPLEQTILQKHVPPAISGQIYASLTALRYAAGPLGLVLGGWFAEQFSIAVVLFVSGALLFATAVVGWVWWPIDHSLARDR